MADEQPQPKPSFMSSRGFRIGLLLVLVASGAGATWYYMTRGQESTDDAQVDAHVVQISSRLGGMILKVGIEDNQQVDAGAILVEIDPRDYQVAVERARAELADAEASALAAQSDVPITSTSATSNVTNMQGSVDSARGAIDAADKEVEAAKARLTTAQARLREVEANAARAARDVERYRGLLAKDEVSQQQFDTVAAGADAQHAAVDSARSQITEAEAGIKLAESHRMQATAGEQQAQAGLRSAQTAPQQINVMKARAAAAEARVAQAKAKVEQAEIDLQHTTIKAPARGVVSKKSINAGQIVQPGQPLFALVQTDQVWITANFKETQLEHMQPGQPAEVKVDAYGGRTFAGKIDSISPATGARFSLLPPENATGNFVKVVQRVPVKIVIEGNQDAEHILRPGMSVTAKVVTR